MGLGFPNALLTVVFQIQREIERKIESLGIYHSKVHSLECHEHGSSNWGGDFECTRPLEHSEASLLNRLQYGNIQIACMSFSLQICTILWFLKPFIYVVLDLEIPSDRCMHPTKSKAQEWSNSRFPTNSTQDVAVV